MVPSEQRPGAVCARCGGSGMLRLGDQSFRTCLDCLGQGRLKPLRPATTTAAAQKAASAAAASAVPTGSPIVTAALAPDGEAAAATSLGCAAGSEDACDQGSVDRRPVNQTAVNQTAVNQGSQDQRSVASAAAA